MNLTRPVFEVVKEKDGKWNVNVSFVYRGLFFLSDGGRRAANQEPLLG
jgi:hypothetical protein